MMAARRLHRVLEFVPRKKFVHKMKLSSRIIEKKSSKHILTNPFIFIFPLKVEAEEFSFAY